MKSYHSYLIRGNVPRNKLLNQIIGFIIKLSTYTLEILFQLASLECKDFVYFYISIHIRSISIFNIFSAKQSFPTMK